MKLIDRINRPTNELRQHLTVRTCNLLESVGITTIEQLKEADDIALLKIPTFGKRGLAECLDFLTNYLKGES